MEYTITPSDDGTFILIVVKGSISRQTGMEINLEAHALGRKLGINRYLVDVTEARNTDSPIENYEFAYSDMQKMEGIDRSARVATLISLGDHSHDFVETVSINAGLNVKIFSDRDQAKRFLAEEEPPE